MLRAGRLFWGTWLLAPTVCAEDLFTNPTSPVVTGEAGKATKAFDDFISQFQKDYTEAEKGIRFAVFKRNLEVVIGHNEAGNRSYDMELTQFADLSVEEFIEIYGMKAGLSTLDESLGMEVGTTEHVYNKEALTDLPSSLDWRQSGAVTHVKDQGRCGSCWAFATIASLEGAWKLATGTLLELSEQQLVDCAGETWGNFGCGGGEPLSALAYGVQNPICNEASYPYIAVDFGQCRNRGCMIGIPSGGITGAKRVRSQDDNALLTAVNQGPVAVAIEADAQVFQLYGGGVIQGLDCGVRLDHAVLLVGYGADGGNDYWLLKNSWGKVWGEHGYVRLGRGSSGQGGHYGVCGILREAEYPQVDGTKAQSPARLSLFLGAAVCTLGLCCCVKKSCRRRSDRTADTLPLASNGDLPATVDRPWVTGTGILLQPRTDRRY